MNFSFHSIGPLIEPDLRIIAVYALGSVVRDELRAESDIDLALLLAPGASMSATEVAARSNALAEIVGRRVDLGVLSAKNLVYTRQALLTGQCVYRRPLSQAALMVATWLGLYAGYQEERREVLRAYTVG